MAVSVGAVVKTPYGVGKVTAFREENAIYEIELTSWSLSDGQKVHVFSQESQFSVVEEKKEEVVVAVAAAAAAAAVDEKKEEAIAAVEAPKEVELKVGTQVKTVYGVGTIVEIRDDSIYHVQLSSWTLSNESTVHVFGQKSQLQAIDVVDEKKTEAAVEPAVVETEIVAEEDNTPKAVKTQYGMGIIVGYRDEDEIFDIELTSWTLSGDQKVHCFLQQSQFTLVDTEGKNVPVDKLPTKPTKGDKGCCTIM